MRFCLRLCTLFLLPLLTFPALSVRQSRRAAGGSPGFSAVLSPTLCGEQTKELPRTLSAPRQSPPATSAASMALFDPADGLFLSEHDADARRPMASTTKIMTALVILSRCNLEETVTVPPEAVGVEGSSVYLFAGEKMTVRTLLYALLLSSANDAAATLAIHCAGSIEAFASLMNEKAAELGLADTHFKNPHGLPDPDHYTTAHDLCRLAAAALDHPTFAEIVATRRYSAPQQGTDATRLFLNHNRLLSNYEGAVGVKTGFTKTAGRCLVSAARKNGLLLVAVTLSDGNDWRDHAALYDWAFSEYEAFDPGALSFSLPVVGGQSESVTVRAEAPAPRTLARNHPPVSLTVEAPRFLFAGVEAGKPVGWVVYRMGEEELSRVPLLPAESVPARPKKHFWQRLFGR